MQTRRFIFSALLVAAAFAVLSACAGRTVHTQPGASPTDAAGDPVVRLESERCRMWMPAGAQGPRHPPAWSPGPGGGFSRAGNCARLQADLPPGAVLVREHSRR